MHTDVLLSWTKLALVSLDPATHKTKLNHKFQKNGCHPVHMSGILIHHCCFLPCWGIVVPAPPEQAAQAVHKGTERTGQGDAEDEAAQRV